MISTKSLTTKPTETAARAITRIAVWMVAGTAVAGASLGVTSTTACGEAASCTQLRNSTYASKAVWDSCDPQDPEPCIKVFGNQKDCTGVLTCDFAVNPRHRVEAEQAVLTMGQQSQSCYLCATPNCVGGEIAMCEPVSRRCIIVTHVLLDAGLPPPPVLDAGSQPE